ncbi:MAG: hypothetical protein R2856_23270 [Caldilineaceae bacterium]
MAAYQQGDREPQAGNAAQPNQNNPPAQPPPPVEDRGEEAKKLLGDLFAHFGLDKDDDS